MKKALVIGIDEYPGSPLHGCVNDAQAMAGLLENNGDGSPNFDVRLACNIKTKAHLLDLLEELFSTGESDISLLYFSGHGTDYGSGFLVTPDYKGRDMGVSMTDLLRLANSSKSKNTIIILDCCFSGKLGESGISTATESILGEGVTIMTASRKDEVSIEDGYTGHGVFTSLLIEGLKGGAADVGGNITPASLYSFVDQSLGAWEQRPLFKTNISKFLPVRKIEAKVPKHILRKLCNYFPNPTDEYSLDPSYEFTNTPEVDHIVKKPYANKDNVAKFSELQLYESVGLIEPVGTEHMYFAAIENKSCKLTALGLHYWRLSKDRRF